MEKHEHEVSNPRTQAFRELVTILKGYLDQSTTVKPITYMDLETEKHTRSIILQNGDIKYTLERLERAGDSGYSPESGTSFEATLIVDRHISRDNHDITTIFGQEFLLPSSPEAVWNGSEEHLDAYSTESIQRLTELLRNAQIISK